MKVGWCLYLVLQHKAAKTINTSLDKILILLQSQQGILHNIKCQMHNATHQMHFLLAVSFTHICLRLTFNCWKGPNTICCSFQQKSNSRQTRVKHSAFGCSASSFFQNIREEEFEFSQKIFPKNFTSPTGKQKAESTAQLQNQLPSRLSLHTVQATLISLRARHHDLACLV